METKTNRAIVEIESTIQGSDSYLCNVTLTKQEYDLVFIYETCICI